MAEMKEKRDYGLKESFSFSHVSIEKDNNKYKKVEIFKGMFVWMKIRRN